MSAPRKVTQCSGSIRYGKRKRTDDEIIEAWNKTGTLSATLKELDMNWGSGDTVKKVLFRYKLVDTI